MTFDIRNVFRAISDQLQAEFKKTAGVRHTGGRGTLREDALSKFLVEYLPKRYAVGRGEVITPENRTSGQLDIVLYDDARCPVLITSPAHSVFPVESVFGALSVKSKLSSSKLREGYKNVQSLKEILPRSPFSLSAQPGFLTGMSAPVPVTGIVAYAASRSLEAIAAQAKVLDGQLADFALRPDFIAVLGQGIVGPRSRLRSETNSYSLPDDREDAVEVRKTGRHTLLQLYMQLVSELNMLTLRPLDLYNYNDLPRLVGQHRVRYDRFGQPDPKGSDQVRAVRLTETAILDILTKATPVSLGQNLLHMVGSIPAGIEAVLNLEETVYEYNPLSRPPLTSAGRDGFRPVSLQIDDRQYSVDLSALPDGSFEEDPDFTFHELMSSRSVWDV